MFLSRVILLDMMKYWKVFPSPCIHKRQRRCGVPESENSFDIHAETLGIFLMRTSTSSTSQLSVCGEREFSFRIPCNNSWQKKGAMIRDAAFPSLSKTRKQRRLFQHRLLIPPIPSGRWFYFFSSCFCAKLRAAPTPPAARHEADTRQEQTRVYPKLSLSAFINAALETWLSKAC